MSREQWLWTCLILDSRRFQTFHKIWPAVWNHKVCTMGMIFMARCCFQQFLLAKPDFSSPTLTLLNKTIPGRRLARRQVYWKLKIWLSRVGKSYIHLCSLWHILCIFKERERLITSFLCVVSKTNSILGGSEMPDDKWDHLHETCSCTL